ncbi:DUF805 domain-containing protein [Acidithiobacillus sp. M4-SHS-6]|uniref:DUF805 domain-containing protein n=1 Tax=Acidithiobacillus sp. M4-SHS-6 TaxID=3383024 RepID=UPI0039BDF4B7
MRMINAYLNVIQNNYFQFNGRMQRAEFWWFVLMNTLIFIAIWIVFIVLLGMKNIGMALLIIYYLALLLPTLGAQVRRLHDIGISGWWLLIALVPYVGGIALLVMEVLPAKPSGEKYGPYHDSVA